MADYKYEVVVKNNFKKNFDLIGWVQKRLRDAGIDPKSYEIFGNSILTSSRGVVDFIMSFYYRPQDIFEIKEW